MPPVPRVSLSLVLPLKNRTWTQPTSWLEGIGTKNRHSIMGGSYDTYATMVCVTNSDALTDGPGVGHLLNLYKKNDIEPETASKSTAS